jgi:hypothetical protein
MAAGSTTFHEFNSERRERARIHSAARMTTRLLTTAPRSSLTVRNQAVAAAGGASAMTASVDRPPVDGLVQLGLY